MKESTSPTQMIFAWHFFSEVQYPKKYPNWQLWYKVFNSNEEQMWCKTNLIKVYLIQILHHSTIK